MNGEEADADWGQGGERREETGQGRRVERPLRHRLFLGVGWEGLGGAGRG